MIRPCPIKIDCPPASPTTNYSSEDLDLNLFRSVVYGADGCIRRCTSLISQADAELCALRQLVECENPPPDVIFLNEAQSCEAACPDGSSRFIYTVPAGTFAGTTQEEANAYAYSYACAQLPLNRICLGAITTALCVGSSVNETIPLTGSSAADLTWASAGALPDGLSLDGGVISGTPTLPGTYSFSVAATDINGNQALANYTMTVIEIVDNSLPMFTIGVGYSHQMTGDGGSAYVWSIVTGTLPTGMTFSESGLLSGTPTAGESVGIVFQLEDASGAVCRKELGLLKESAPAFNCCQSVGNYWPVAYSSTFDRVAVGHTSPGSPTDNPLRIFDPECNGLAEISSTFVSGGAAWVPSVSRFYFGVDEHGGLADENVGILNPADNSVTYIGGFPIAAGMVGRNAIWVPETSRVWLLVSQFSDEMAIIDPSDNSFVLLNNVLLQGMTDYCYCPDNQAMYALTGGNRLVKIDVNSLVITNLAAIAFADYSAITGFTMTYVSSQQKIWYSFRGFRAGFTRCVIGMIDINTDLRSSVWERAITSPVSVVVWYSSDVDRVLVYDSGDPYFQIWEPTVTNSGDSAGKGRFITGYTLTAATKGAYITDLDEVVIPGVDSGAFCLLYFTSNELLTAPLLP